MKTKKLLSDGFLFVCSMKQRDFNKAVKELNKYDYETVGTTEFRVNVYAKNEEAKKTIEREIFSIVLTESKES